MNDVLSHGFQADAEHGRSWQLLWRAMLLSSLMLLLTLLGLGLFSFSSRRKLDQRLAEIRARGEPTTAEEAAAFYAPPPKDQDVTELWLKAGKTFSGREFTTEYHRLPVWVQGAPDDEPLPLPGQPWPEFEKAVALLERNSEALQWVYQAAERGGRARFPFSIRSATINMYRELYNIDRALRLAAHVHSYRGDADQTARCLQADLSLARAFRQYPRLVEFLRAHTVQWRACVCLAHLLPHTGFSDDALQQVQELLRGNASRQCLKRALMIERCFATDAYRYPEQSWIFAGQSWVTWLYAADWLLYLDHMKSVIDLTELPLHQALDQAMRMDEELGASDARFRSLNFLLHPISRTLTVAPTAYFHSAARSEATSHAADAMIACERYRRRHDRLPERLDDLVPQYLPAVPLDPFNGQPLRYQQTGRGFIVYSVGQNRTDEGGKNLETPSVGDWGLAIQYAPPPANQ